jgi:hypothetical protein
MILTLLSKRPEPYNIGSLSLWCEPHFRCLRFAQGQRAECYLCCGEVGRIPPSLFESGALAIVAMPQKVRLDSPTSALGRLRE